MGYLPAAPLSSPARRFPSVRPLALPRVFRVRTETTGTNLGGLISQTYAKYGVTNPFAPAPAAAPPPYIPPPTPTPTPVAPAPYVPPPPVSQAPPPYVPPPPISYNPVASAGQGIPESGVPAVAAAAAPILAPISPAAGAVAALAPAVMQAAAQEPSTQIRFTGDSPAFTAAEVYNADGAPVTPAAKVATFANTIRNLPPAAQVGGAVLLFLFLSRR